MKFNFLSIATPENGYASEFSAALAKVKAAMQEGGDLVISPRTDSNGYPYYWIEAIRAHKTQGTKVLAGDEVTNMLFHYLTLGKIADVTPDVKECEELREEFSGKNFAFELLRYEVEQGKRVHITSQPYSNRFRCFTVYTKGRVMYSLEMTEEVKAFLEEKDLL